MAVGVLQEGINEVIVTTTGNAAPIGIIYRNNKYSAVLFQGSHTGRLAVADGWMVANLVHDPVIYVVTAFEDLPGSSYCDETAGGLSVCRLKECDAWAAFRVRPEKETSASVLVSLTLIMEVVRSTGVEPVNRGFFGIIEATVHATRYVMTHSPQLRDLILHHAAITRKCGGPREQEALQRLGEYLKERKAPIKGL